MKHTQQSRIAGMALSCLIFLASCTHDKLEPVVVLPKLKLSTSTTLGSYLADSLNNTLYYFSNDFDGKSNCTGGCLALWPIYYAPDLTQAKLPTDLDIADFGTITTSTGAPQTTYKSWPLYYYAPVVGGVNTRESPGETKGEGVGNIWYVAKPDYSIMLVSAQLTGSNGKTYKSDYTEGTGKTVYFADAKGVTLYGFKNDSFNINRFTKPDFSNNPTWPIYETDKVVVPSTLDKTLFASITVAGRKQLTYKGWPMYHFGADSLKRGLNKGITFPAAANPPTWPVMIKDAVTAPHQ